MGISELPARNIPAAKAVLRDLDVVAVWESIGAKVNLAGSLKTGRLAKRLDIGFHSYTPELRAKDGFRALAKLAADRVAAVLTPETKNAILQLKFDTPDDEKITGIEYSMAVLQDGIRDYGAFTTWRRNNPPDGSILWAPEGHITREIHGEKSSHLRRDRVHRLVSPA